MMGKMTFRSRLATCGWETVGGRVECDQETLPDVSMNCDCICAEMTTYLG